MLHRLLGLLVLAASFAAAWVWMAYQDFVESPLKIPPEGLVYQVAPGASVGRVAAELAAAGVLDSPERLRWYARWSDQAHRIKAGEYRLAAGLTGPALLALLVEGRTVSHGLTLVEGWNFRQVRAAVASDPVLEQTLAGLSDDEVMERLGYPGQHPEGRFFPDTYLFPRGTSDVEFLQRAYRRMEAELAELWPQRQAELPLETPYEALILASIVEKETGVPEERGAIAGVFARRLRLGMKLQTDPTVIYGMGERYDGNIRKADLREDTPYNTYVHKGLPPTPICMPGRAALEATLHPVDTGAVYFVARGDGSHEFSETLQAHNAAVRKYQLGQGSR
jgi:UPF0755 protein